MSRKLVAEFIGTFGFVFIGAGSAAVGYGGLAGIAIATGISLFVFISLLGPISGGHLNPAVTLAMLARGYISPKEGLAYMGVQLLASLASAGLLGILLFHSCIDLGSTHPTETVSAWQAIGIEMVLTFFLVFSIFRGLRSENKNLIPSAVACIVIGGIMFAGPLTGGSFNPARSFGPCLLSSDISTLWIYFVGPFAGALLGNYADKLLTQFTD